MIQDVIVVDADFNVITTNETSVSCPIEFAKAGGPAASRTLEEGHVP
jgi:hypothetical protein